jgi:hypothetical protein
MDGLSPKLRRQLVELRRVVPRGDEPTADVETYDNAQTVVMGDVMGIGGVTVEIEPETIVELIPTLDPEPQKQLTCGDYGGRTKLGAPCGKNPENDGPCRWHKLN